MPFPFAGEVAALATAVCWTATSMAFEAAGKRVGSLAVNLIRLIMAFFFMAAYTAITRGHALPDDASAHTWLWLSASGVVGFTIGDLCLFRAFVLLGARLSMLLMALVPPFTALIGLAILGEELALLDWLGMTLTLSGVAWVIAERRPANGGDQPSGISRAGIVLGTIGALGQAGGLVLSKYGMRGYDPFASTHIRIIAGIVSFSILFLIIGWWPRVIGACRDRAAMASTTLGAVFGPFLGVSLSLVAIKYTETGVAATIMALVPVLIIPPAVLIMKETVSPRAILGSLVAVAGVALLFQ
jgi:drug/metabolite transporter (DMT)-like permease